MYMMFHESIVRILPNSISLNQTECGCETKYDKSIRHDILYFPNKSVKDFNFLEIIIDMVWRLVSNNLYSIFVNGQAYGFFIHLGVENKDIIYHPSYFSLLLKCLLAV
ncbi:hypothetical protein H5410_059946 [Solanum commersonii]|uniref:Uncharacterized protein n=1 Tax=Solanum commersonii TaxID=4109 RepID=A0A9J5W4J2_SOLCO|nr:hypothetical protein H5410_059946 [Solanum commersonii]